MLNVIRWRFFSSRRNLPTSVYGYDSSKKMCFQITVAEDQRHDIAELYTKWTIGQMRRRYPNFDWLLFFNTIFENITDKDGRVIRFDDSAEVVIYGVDFVERLDKLLPQFQPRSGIVTYIILGQSEPATCMDSIPFV